MEDYLYRKLEYALRSGATRYTDVLQYMSATEIGKVKHTDLYRKGLKLNRLAGLEAKVLLEEEGRERETQTD